MKIKEKEIARIHHEDNEYILGVDIFDIIIKNKQYKVASPRFAVTLKSAKKKRDKIVKKYNARYDILPIKNPLVLFNKIYKIFDDILKNYNYIYMYTWEDMTEKREKVYISCLQKMGFKLIYIDKKIYFINTFIFGRNNDKLKDKTIKRLLGAIEKEYE